MIFLSVAVYVIASEDKCVAYRIRTAQEPLKQRQRYA